MNQRDVKRIEKQYIRGLCFRCEFRALYLETGFGPRCECKDVQSSSYSCYAFKPVMPLVVKPRTGDRRSLYGGMLLGGRMTPVARSEMELHGKKVKHGYLAYWLPKEEKNEHKKGK